MRQQRSYSYRQFLTIVIFVPPLDETDRFKWMDSVLVFSVDRRRVEAGPQAQMDLLHTRITEVMTG
jgi:hypothetical protein